MSSCVLYTSPSPRVAVDHLKTAPLRDWLLQRNTASCGEKVELVSTFLVQLAAFLSGNRCASDHQAETDRGLNGDSNEWENLHFHWITWFGLNTALCLGQTTRYFCPLKCSVWQVRPLKSHKFLPCLGWETRQTTHCSSISHRLQVTICMTSLARKRSLLTTASADKQSWEVNKNQTCWSFCREASSMQRRLSSIMTHYARLNDRLLCPMHIDWLSLGWFCVVWT